MIIKEKEEINMFINPALKRYKIVLDVQTAIYVNENQITRPRWIEHFGSLEAVENFIKSYNE